MNNRPTPETDRFKVKFKTICGEKYWVPVEHSERLERERDEAREARNECERQFQQKVAENIALLSERDEAQEELSSIYRWVERHNQDGFDDKLTHRQNVDICYDLLYDRLDMAELELNRIKRAVIATLDENRHLADGLNCTLIKLKTAVPTWV